MSEITRTLSVPRIPETTQPATVKRYPEKSRFLSRGMLTEIMMAYDLASIFAAGFVAKYLYLAVQSESKLGLFGSVMLLVALGFHFVAHQRGLYDPARLTDFQAQFSSVLYVWITTCASLFLTLFLLKISDQISRLWCLEWLFLLLPLLTLGRLFIIRFFQRMDRTGVLRRFVVLIGFGSQFSALREHISNDNQHYSLCSVVDLAAVAEISEEEALKVAVGFVQSAHEFEVDDIMIALPPGFGSLANLILREIQKVPADIHIVPDLGGLQYSALRIGKMGELSYFTTTSKPIAGWGAFFKKLVDYPVAAIGLVLMAPIMLFIAAAIKLDSRGPVFFRQRRHGYNHKVIEVLKFRSMTCMDDGDKVVQASKNDQRVTRVGNLLRRSSLDELPQLINVLKGDMSIVGPRPHALAHNSYYGDLVENYSNRHRVKPGITGWAQVHGYRGETGSPEKMAQRVRCDLEYIDNWSIWLDIKIIVLTPIFGIFRRGAF